MALRQLECCGIQLSKNSFTTIILLLLTNLALVQVQEFRKFRQTSLINKVQTIISWDGLKNGLIEPIFQKNSTCMVTATAVI